MTKRIKVQPKGLAIIYARVSTSEQAENYSIQSQIAECLRVAAELGYRVPEEYICVDEGYSGETLDRPGLTRFRELISRPDVELAVIHDPDRLSRKLSHQLLLQEEIERSGTSLRFVTPPLGETPEAKVLFQMKGVFAEYEREKIRERCLRGLIAKAREGFIPSGKPPYGYELSERGKNKRATLVINEEEAGIVKLIFQLYAHERLSLREISKNLMEMGIKAPMGGNWDPSTIRDILSRETYIGRYYFRKRMAVEPKRPIKRSRKTRKTSRKPRPKDEWILISVPRIVDEMSFELAQRRLSENRARLSGRKDKHLYLLRGMITCSSCGRRYYGFVSKHYRYYGCSTKLRKKGNCRARNISAERIEGFVWETIEAFLINPENLIKYMEDNPDEGHNLDIRATREALQKIQAQKDKLYQLLLDDGIRVPELRERIQSEYQELSQRETLLRAEIEAFERDEAERLSLRERITSALEYARELGRAAEHLTQDERAEIISLLLDEIILEDHGDHWSVHLKGALPCSWNGSGSQGFPHGGPETDIYRCVPILA